MAQDEFYCEDCRMTFETKADLDEHNGSTHSRYTCEVCGAILTSQREMEDHTRHLHPETERTPR